MQTNLKMFLITLVATTMVGTMTITRAFAADDTTKEKVSEAANDTKRAAKKTVRKAKDEVCEMVNGKMKCVGKKIKHSAQNAGDAIEDAVD